LRQTSLLDILLLMTVVSRDRNELALRNLAYLRNLPENAQYVQDEYEDIRMALDADRKRAGVGFFAPITALFTSGNLIKRLVIAVSLFICQNGTGINAINYYSPTIFKSIGVTVSIHSSGKPFNLFKQLCSHRHRVRRRLCSPRVCSASSSSWAHFSGYSFSLTTSGVEICFSSVQSGVRLRCTT